VQGCEVQVFCEGHPKEVMLQVKTVGLALSQDQRWLLRGVLTSWPAFHMPLVLARDMALTDSESLERGWLSIPKCWVWRLTSSFGKMYFPSLYAARNQSQPGPLQQYEQAFMEAASYW